jgi:hypothetical protein
MKKMILMMAVMTAASSSFAQGLACLPKESDAKVKCVVLNFPDDVYSGSNGIAVASASVVLADGSKMNPISISMTYDGWGIKYVKANERVRFDMSWASLRDTGAIDTVIDAGSLSYAGQTTCGGLQEPKAVAACGIVRQVLK